MALEVGLEYEKTSKPGGVSVKWFSKLLMIAADDPMNCSCCRDCGYRKYLPQSVQDFRYEQIIGLILYSWCPCSYSQSILSIIYIHVPYQSIRVIMEYQTLQLSVTFLRLSKLAWWSLDSLWCVNLFLANQFCCLGSDRSFGPCLSGGFTSPPHWTQLTVTSWVDSLQVSKQQYQQLTCWPKWKNS